MGYFDNKFMSLEDLLKYCSISTSIFFLLFMKKCVSFLLESELKKVPFRWYFIAFDKGSKMFAIF